MTSHGEQSFPFLLYIYAEAGCDMTSDFLWADYIHLSLELSRREEKQNELFDSWHICDEWINGGQITPQHACAIKLIQECDL